MRHVPEDLRARLREYGQEHVLAWWDRLADIERRELLEQLQSLDLEQLRRLYAQRDQVFTLPPVERIQPAPVVRLGEDPAEARGRGEECLRRGEVAALVVAGGQGSRLGFDQPKGMFQIGPVSNKTLFQLHAEKVLATSRRYGKPVPLLVMTSPATHAETEEFFARHGYFGLPPGEVHFFQQGTMPALHMDTGRLILEAPGRLFLSPNGHGGTLTALADSGLLDLLRARGIRHVFYFQVDNPLVKVADPVFLGRHVAADAEVSSKVVAKDGPLDRLGVFALIDGRCGIIEYSDLPEDLAHRTDERGKLWLWAGSPAIHLFDVNFLGRVTQGASRIPFHVARKKVPYLDEAGVLRHPEKENAFKFEMFIFDALPLADRWTLVETSRRQEFAPLKNATGPDSPDEVRKALVQQAADWLHRAGVSVLRRHKTGEPLAVEISPLFALDPEELAEKVESETTVMGPTYFRPKEEA
jgi:UDP-N-acetylglucosamine/UDP-N-acetylgalactosamine diphosphorylase